MIIPFSFQLSSIYSEKEDFNISFFEIEEVLGIEIRRFYMLKSGDLPAIRGNHAHKNQDQILLKLSGEASVSLTSELGEESNWQLQDEGLFIPRKHWIEVKMAPNSQVLCLATMPYKQLQTESVKKNFLKTK